MKKHIFIILLALLLLLCACQSTPENPIVVGKDQSAMIEKAQEKPGYTTGETVDWRERLAVPERYSVKLKSNGGRLTVDVDAEVIVPDAELPIAHVSPRRFSDDDAQRFVKALLGDDPQCISREGDNRTKAMYERMIVERNYALDNWDDYGCIVWDMYDTREEMQEALQELIDRAADAPDTLETFAPVFEWEPMLWSTAAGQKDLGDENMGFLTLNADGTRSLLDITNGGGGTRSGIVYHRDIDGIADQLETIEGRWQNELTITEDEAKSVAEAKLKEMGLDHLACAFSKFVRCYRMDGIRVGAPYEPGWLLVFTPSLNGIPLTYSHRLGVENNEYTRYWQYERCLILVDEKGVSILNYQDACTADEVKTETATLLPFSDITAIFEKMVSIVDNNADAFDFDQTYRITSIRLGWVTVPEQNGEGGLTVPCWDFMGDIWAEEEFPESWKQTGMMQDGSLSYLTINAIDGSIIQRGQ